MKVKCEKCKQSTWEASFKEYLLAPKPRLCYKCMFNFNENEIASGKHETIMAVVRLPHVVNIKPLEGQIIEYAEKHGYSLQNMSSVPLPYNAYAETHYIFTKIMKHPIRTCGYCGANYDLSKTSSCPKCGAT